MSFSYDGGDAIFNQVNLNLDSSWKLGLIGRNGRGKTTLLNILQNKLSYTGTIDTNVSFKYFPTMIQDKTANSGDILTNLVPIENQWKFDRELSLLGVDLNEISNRSFDTLSGGEKTKFLTALSFIDDDDFILLDEPTNHLDAQTRHQLIQYLRQKTGFIVISHDRQFLNAIIDHVVAIEQSQLRLYHGNFELYEHEKELRDQEELAEHTKLKRDINRLSETAREKAKWSDSREQSKLGKRTEFNSKNRGDKGFEGARAARTMKRSKQLVDRKNAEITKKEGLLQDLETSDKLDIQALQSAHRTLLTLNEFSIGYDAPLFAPLTLSLKQGEILAITGSNGTGKSALIKALLDNEALITSGTYHWASQLKVSQVRQETDQLQGDLQAFSELHHVNHEALLNMLYKLGVPRKTFIQPIEQMSSGQKKRVELAKSLLTPAHVFIWDEPLNYLDVFNQKQIEALILSVKPTMLIIEHDQVFLKNIGAKQIELQPI